MKKVLSKLWKFLKPRNIQKGRFLFVPNNFKEGLMLSAGIEILWHNQVVIFNFAGLFFITIYYGKMAKEENKSEN